MLMAGALVALSAAGQNAIEPPDDDKVSYALGMKLGLEIKRTGADVDVNTIVQAIKDVMDGKPTQIAESEMRPILQEAMAYQRAAASKKNKAEGEAFLAKNAKEPGVTVLPDGLQYRVLKAGNGPTPKADDNVVINSLGTLIDGKVIDQKEHFQVSVSGQMKGLEEALKMMPIGAKWQVVAPPALAFGGDWKGDVGPGSTVIFEIELLSISPSVHSAANSSPTFGHTGARVVGQGQETNTISNTTLPSARGKN